MTVTTNYYGDNSFAPGMTQDAYIPDQLISGPGQLITASVTCVATTGGLVRGTLMGQQLIGSATAVAGKPAGGANTGTGTCSAVTNTSIIKVGVYTVTFTAATAFTVTDPNGVEMAAGVTGTAYADDLGFTITAGGTAFVAGDGFEITVAVGSGNWAESVSTATDGSQNPSAILVDNQPAGLSAGTTYTGGLYMMGEFNVNALTLGSGITLTPAVLANLRIQGIFIRTPVSAADPATEEPI